MFIYTNENNPAALKLLIAAKFGGRPVEVAVVNIGDRSVEEPRHFPFLKVNNETSIFVTNAAVWFLLPTPQSVAEKVNEWAEWESTILAPTLALAIGGKNDKLKPSLINALKKLNAALQKESFLTDNNVNASDIIVWSTLYPLIKDAGLSKDFLSENQHISAWSAKIERTAQVQEALKSCDFIVGAVAYQALLAGAKYLSAGAPVGEAAPQSPQHQADAVTPEELTAAAKAWSKHPNLATKLKSRPKIILPQPNEKNILITSALPYVNNVPHLGNIIGCVLSGDVFARFCRICNYNTVFIGGTDEYGTATETKALEEGLSCKEICDKFYAIHKDIYEWFNIGFDYFGRSSAPEQTEICQDLFLQLNNNGFIFTESVEQLHCEQCNRFLADRFVEGECPHLGCTYEDARGDQCDGCGKLVNAIELKNPRCKVCKTTPKTKSSVQFFLDLPKLEPLLLHWMKQSAPGWSNNAQVIGKAWIREGLKPRCITRDLKWGVSVPLDGYRDKVFYVWYDAPIGYMSMTKGYTKQWEEWWKPKAEAKVTLYQFMAKDNVPFHSVMFPACLMGTNRGYVTVSHIMATEYLNYEDGKFSKSRGVGVFGNDARDTGIPSDVWRFYLLYVRPESQDSCFSWADLATKNNSELLNNLGNFINRSLVFAKNNFDQTVPEIRPDNTDFTLLALCTRELKGYISCLEKAKLRDGIRHILSISRHGNQYMQANQPWVLLKGSPDEKIRAGTVIGICCNLACLLATMLHPYMPATCETLRKQLQVDALAAFTPENVEITQLLAAGHKLGEPFPLFAKLEPSMVEELKQKFAGKQGDNSPKVNGVAPGNTVSDLEAQVAKQADKVRILKSSGANKTVWQPEVAILLDLKKKLEAQQKSAPVKNGALPVKALEEAVAKQADKVRVLKSSADKKVWQPEVAILLDLKKQLEAAQKSGAAPAQPSEAQVKKLEEEIDNQGLVVRKLKESGASKADVQPEVTKLLSLKSQLSSLTGAPSAAPKGKKK